MVILSQFVNVRFVLESINGQSQRADCLCTMHAVGIPIVDGVRGVCAWLVDEPCDNNFEVGSGLSSTRFISFNAV